MARLAWGGGGGEPAVTAEEVCAHASGLVALLGPSSPIGRLAVGGRPDAARRALGPFRDAFGERLHVGVRQRVRAGARDGIRAMLRLAGRAGGRGGGGEGGRR